MCQNHQQSQSLSSVGSTSTSTHSPEGNTMSDRTQIVKDCQRVVIDTVVRFAGKVNARINDRQYRMLEDIVEGIITKVAPERIICSDCGTDDNAMLEDNKCDGCFMKCESCDEIVHRDDSMDDDYCLECAVKCRYCDEVVNIADADWCDFYSGDFDKSEWLCQQCGAECHECGEVEVRDEMGTNPEEDDCHYCQTCSTECESCSNRHGDEHMTQVDGLYYCADCVDSAKETYEAEQRLEAMDVITDTLKHYIQMLRPTLGEEELNELVANALDEVDITRAESCQLTLYDVLADCISHDN